MQNIREKGVVKYSNHEINFYNLAMEYEPGAAQNITICEHLFGNFPFIE